MAKKRTVSRETAPSEGAWLVVWYRTYGRESPVLMRQLDERTLRILAIAEEGVTLEDIPLAGARYFRPVSLFVRNDDGTPHGWIDYPPARALKAYRNWANSRGASSEVWHELGGAPDRGVATPVPTPRTEPLGDTTEAGDDPLVELYQRAARLLETPIDALMASLAHCNRGMQAMQLRAKLRNAGWQV